jgi:FkbM family methyltransferase
MIEDEVCDEGYETEGVGEYILELFGDYKGVCVDVGAYHSRWLSNSYLLEKNGWAVYCIEPNPYCREFLAERKHVYQYAIGPENRDNVDFFIFDIGLPREDIKVQMRTLDWFLVAHTNEDNVDFLSIDVEGSEMSVLRGIDLDHWKVKAICIENIDEGVTEQLDCLTARGFTKTERFMYNDIYERF